MSMTGNENPFYEHFDEICEICAEHDVTIYLGDACRPGCLADATDVCQIEELVRSFNAQRPAEPAEDEEYPESYLRLVEQLERFF